MAAQIDVKNVLALPRSHTTNHLPTPYNIYVDAFFLLQIGIMSFL